MCDEGVSKDISDYGPYRTPGFAYMASNVMRLGLGLGGEYDPFFLDRCSSLVAVLSQINARFVEACAWPRAWLAVRVGGC
ncbi:hypothetical protein DY000_02034300 [Brassica cretica]|uniref:Uncharacterized protein n=1 Tax=Brassica cretica TaxID=69181 RepID=A0ABQ7DME6_BRACR|nr:hypothetical protein DY000_02034300 [Brassica cretica]